MEAQGRGLGLLDHGLPPVANQLVYGRHVISLLPQEKAESLCSLTTPARYSSFGPRGAGRVGQVFRPLLQRISVRTRRQRMSVRAGEADVNLNHGNVVLYWTGTACRRKRWTARQRTPTGCRA